MMMCTCVFSYPGFPDIKVSNSFAIMNEKYLRNAILDRLNVVDSILVKVVVLIRLKYQIFPLNISDNPPAQFKLKKENMFIKKWTTAKYSTATQWNKKTQFIQPNSEWLEAVSIKIESCSNKHSLGFKIPTLIYCLYSYIFHIAQHYLPMSLTFNELVVISGKNCTHRKKK